MSVFTVNIDPRPIVFYSGLYYYGGFSGTDPVYEVNTVGLVQAGAQLADKYLLNSFDTSHTPKFLHIKILNYIAPDGNIDFGLYYNGIKLQPYNDVITTINIETMSIGDPIPGLLLKYLDHDPGNFAEIMIEIRITDTLDYYGWGVTSEFYMSPSSQSGGGEL